MLLDTVSAPVEPPPSPRNDRADRPDRAERQDARSDRKDDPAPAADRRADAPPSKDAKEPKNTDIKDTKAAPGAKDSEVPANDKDKPQPSPAPIRRPLPLWPQPSTQPQPSSFQTRRLSSPMPRSPIRRQWLRTPPRLPPRLLQSRSWLRSSRLSWRRLPLPRLRPAKISLCRQRRPALPTRPTLRPSKPKRRRAKPSPRRRLLPLRPRPQRPRHQPGQE